MAGHGRVCFLTWSPVASYRTVLVECCCLLQGVGVGGCMVCGHEPCHPRHSWLLRGAVRQEAFSPASCRLWAGQRACLILPQDLAPHSFPPAPVLAALVPLLAPLQGLGTGHAPRVLSPSRDLPQPFHTRLRLCLPPCMLLPGGLSGALLAGWGG